MEKLNICFESSKDNFTEKTGVFISHSSTDESFKRVNDYLTHNKITFLSDMNLSAGDSNYIERIKGFLKNANGGVVLLSSNAFESPWIMYEVGMLEGMGKTIMLYYENAENNTDIKEQLPVLLRKYPIIEDLPTLAQEVSKYSIFGNLFEYDTLSCNQDIFKNAIIGNIENMKLSIKIKNMKEIKEDAIQFGYIILRLARYGEPKEDLDKCMVTRERRIEDMCCCHEESKTSCGFLKEVSCDEAPETVILNKILYHSRTNAEGFDYTIPFHKKYGITFKCFVDVKDISIKNTIVNALEEYGMEDVSYSDSGEHQRIYFLLPKVREKGLFQVVAPDKGNIINNYFCPGALI